MSVAHPSTFLPAAILNEIREHAHEAELLRDLHPRQLQIIRREKWFKMFVPKESGGLGLTLPEVLRIEESLAWADGSTAWVTTLCSGAGWFVGFIDPPLSQKMFHTNDLCVAGSGNVSGTAEAVKDGYEINGCWKYASGSLHATLFTANCAIVENGKPKVDSDGKPLVRAFAFLPNEVQVIRSWNMMGMVATASHSFSVTGLIIPTTRVFQIDAGHAKIADPVYHYPFLQLAETTLTVNLSGLAQRFLDLCEEKFNTSRHLADGHPKPKLHSTLPSLLDNAVADLQAARTSFYAAAETSWNHCKNGDEIPLSVLHEVSITSRALSQACTSIVDKLYPHTGLSAADVSTEINRVWRNFHTGGQHSLFWR
jgi:alkylation response protein AidB-like acyl-CoA dehydrogenase